MRNPVPLSTFLLPIVLLCLVAGPSAAQPATPASEPVAEDRAQIANEIEALQARARAASPGDLAAESAAAELALLERLDNALVRQQSMSLTQARLARAEAAMQQKLAAGPESDVSDTPPYPLALLDLLGDAVDALESQRGVLENADRAAEAALEKARDERGEAERERRRRLEEVDRSSGAVELARARHALRLAELRLRVARSRFEIATLELDAARRDRTLHGHNLTVTRAVLQFVEQHLDLTPELREELVLGLQQRERELRAAREQAALDLERAQERRLAAEKRRDSLELLTPAVLTENEALAARQETLQVLVATLGQQEERLARVRALRERRHLTLAGEAPRPDMREWETELRSLAAELERRQRVEEGRVSQARTVRKQVALRAEDVVEDEVRQRWLDEQLRALDDRIAVHEGEIADLRSTRALALRFVDELGRRTARMTFDDRFQIVSRQAAAVWDTELANLDDRPITLGKVVTALLALVLGLIGARVLSRWIGRFTTRRLSLEEGAAAAFQSLSYYALAVIFLLIALRSANIPLTVFTILGGAFAIGIGFGSQSVISNFISGLILLIERPIKVGDMVEIDGTLGRVDTIGLRATSIRTFDNIHMILPNSAFLEKNVLNWNLRDDIVRGQVNVGVAYGSQTREVERLLLKAATEQDLVLDEPAPSVLFREFGDNALAFRLYFWVRARNVLDRIRIESIIRYRIDELFRESSVVIAFPQRDVHLDTTRPLQIEWTGKDGPEREPGA